MRSSTLTLLFGSLVLLVIYLVKKYTFWQRRKIPIPNGYWPFLGHMWPVYTFTKSLTDHIQDLYKKCNKHSMYGLYDGLTPALVVREPHLIKTVMQSSFANFQKNGFEASVKNDPLLARNPFFTTGEVWQNVRKRLVQAFSTGRLKIMFTAMTRVCKKQQTYLEKQLKSKDQHEMELKHFFGRFTAESVANAGFSIEGYGYEDNPPPNAFYSIGLTMFESNLLSTMLFNIALYKSSVALFLGIPLLGKEANAFFRRLVRENLDIRRKDQSPKQDFFQMMIELENSEGEMNEERIAIDSLSLFFDGFETTRITLSFIGYQLAKHPEIQEKVRNEIRTTLAKNDGVLTFESLKELKYMDQVISESQRLHSDLHLLKKMCTVACDLVGSDGLSVRMEPGMQVYIPINPLHHDAEYWSNPEVFDPDRFSEERKQDIEKMCFLPFGMGPRMCAGFRLGMLMVKSCLASLLNNYKIEMSPKTTVPLKWSTYHFLTEPTSGIWVKVSEV
ncbi:putative cytochrome P450 6a13 [Megalopta genalis]|uniref:putative cytochrome P450 6a13 n=1 Tax=Megalopta genalis TaxID=115081 RepID=UPI003FD42FAF